MTKLVPISALFLSITVSLLAAPIKQLQISVDNQLVTFASPPIHKDNAWLVPIDSVCKKLGLKVEFPENSKMAVICGDENAELCVPLIFGETAFDIDGVSYAKLENITKEFGFEIYKVSDMKFEIIRPQQLATIFTLPDLDDTPRSLQDFRGKKTLLYIWGSW